jgi:hypothetical protein
MNKKLYAFWKYDLFPYILGGEVRDIDDRGLVYIEAYQGRFKPILILPLEKGLAIKKELNNLEREFRTKTKELRQEMLEKVITTCPQFNEFIR